MAADQKSFQQIAKRQRYVWSKHEFVVISVLYDGLAHLKIHWTVLVLTRLQYIGALGIPIYTFYMVKGHNNDKIFIDILLP